MKRIFKISNRLPLEIQQLNGDLRLVTRKDGFATGLKGFYDSHEIKWIGRAGMAIDELSENQRMRFDNEFRMNHCLPVYLNSELKRSYLDGFCDHTLWPLFNYFPQKARYAPEYWEAYQIVNRMYADLISNYIHDDDILWIHDYHLMLLPRLIRKSFPKVSIGYFQHIPFPSLEVFRLLPWRAELLEGLLGADLIGFHTYDYQRHFMSSVRRLLGQETFFNRIKLDERVIKTDAFPKGIDFDLFHARAKTLNQTGGSEDSIIYRDLKAFHERGPGRKVILSIDRLDYTKGIAERVLAFEHFLNRHPDYKGKVSLFLYAFPSRENVIDYQELKAEVDQIVGRVNSLYGDTSWMPVWYFYRNLELDEMIELYSNADVALITPMRDGMNLNAKEYLASRFNETGVLILSELAGAAKELGESIIVNPNNQEEVSEALYIALTMSKKDQIQRNSALRKRLRIYNEERWANDFISALQGVKELQETNYTRKVTPALLQNLKDQYQAGKNRIIFLDYDGTLTGFHNDPQQAIPDQELYSIMEKLTADPLNTVVIISGRDKETLSKWFESYKKLSFIAEHGVWVKNPRQPWAMSDQIDKDWMDIIRPVLENYVDRTPRSLIEQKNYSLVWHYRHADPDLGTQRAWELKDDLKTFLANLNLEIMDGDKVIEVKNAGINKGRAASSKLGKQEHDFILALGDDWTDEYTFSALPEQAFTIKVGTKTTAARFYIEDVQAVRNLLLALIEP